MDEQEAAEKIKNDPRFWIQRFLWLVDKDSLDVPFRCNMVQNAYLAARTHWDLILKARKQGFSTLILALWLHACLFRRNTRAVVVSHEDEATKRLFGKVRYYLDHMGGKTERFEEDLDTDSAQRLTFPMTNSSFWIGTAGSASFGRGDDITHLHASEVAHYKNQQILTGMLEACTNDAYRVLETTANGVGEAFHTLWTDAKDPMSKSPWRPHFVSWFADPLYRTAVPQGVAPKFMDAEMRMKRAYNLSPEQVLWYRTKAASLADKSLMPQEYPSNDVEAFLSSGKRVFDQTRLAEFLDRAPAKAEWIGEFEDDGHTVEFFERQEGNLQVWVMPKQGRSYLICADPSEGVPEGDNAVFHVLDRATWEQCAVWCGLVDPGKFGQILCTVGYAYHNAILVPEANNHGWATLERIKSEAYPHVFHTGMADPTDKNPKMGFLATDKSKELYVSALRNSVDERTVAIRCRRTIREMQTFIRDERGRAVAQEGCKDDHVTSLGIGVYCLKFLTVDESYTRRKQGVVVSKPDRVSKKRTGY